MIEACFCGRVGPLEDREVLFVADGRPALRCPQCGQVDTLDWMSAGARTYVFANARLPQPTELDQALL